MPRNNRTRRTTYKPFTSSEVQAPTRPSRQLGQGDYQRLAAGERTTLSRAPLLPSGHRLNKREQFPKFLTRGQVDGQTFTGPLMNRTTSKGPLAHQLMTQIFSDFQDMEVYPTSRGWEKVEQFSLNRYEIYLRVATVVHCTAGGAKFQKLLDGLDTTLNQMIQQRKIDRINGIYRLCD